MSQSKSQSNIASMIESAIRAEQKEKLAVILKHVSKLSNLEKYYLYMKLPTGQTLDEPIKRNVTPVSSVNRTSSTLKWIRAHYIEDKNVCVSKQEVYNQYRLYCEATNINPVGSADFGKIVKSAFPGVHHRRLGQRGKSKAYYGGLKRRSKVDMPTLPVVEGTAQENPVVVPNPLQEMQNLSSQLICEWAGHLFDKKFMDIKSLAQYLIQTGASYGKKAALFSMMYDSYGVPSRLKEARSQDHKLQDTQALLQRKLHQREVLKEHTRLLNMQKNQRTGASNTAPVVGNQDMTSCPQNGDGNSTISHPYDVPSEMPLSNLIVPTSLPGKEEKLTCAFTKASGMSSSSSLEIKGVHVNIETVNAKSRRAFSKDSFGEREKQKSIENMSSVNEQSSNVSISSISDISMQSPQTNLGMYDHKQQKRTGDMLTGASHERVNKRRRCMTSLGVPHEEFMEDIAVRGESTDQSEIQRIRPISCPTLYNILSSNAQSVSKSSSKDNIILRKKQISSSYREKGSHRSKEKLKSLNREEWSQKKTSASVRSTSELPSQKSNNDNCSFHFVQKPTVIAVRQPGTLFPSVMSCPNLGGSQKFDQESQDPPSDIKRTHNILNSLLSSNTNSSSKPDLSSQTSLTSPLPLSTQHLDDLDTRVNQQGQKLPHTLDNAYILSTLTNRSAFVPVASNKLQDLSRSRSSHPCLSNYSSSRCSSIEKQSTDVFEGESKQSVSSDDEAMKGTSSQKENIAKSPHLSISETDSTLTHVTKCFLVDSLTSDHFKPISYSKCQVSTTSTSVINQSSVTPAISCSPISHSKMFSSNVSSSHNTPNVIKQQNKARTKSPITPPRRQCRSRFTPIRPKITGCTPSPQKKDMRPVSMILKEQRVRNTQELLVNLASTYQGEVKLQMPGELLGLSSPSMVRSSDVLLTIGTPACTSSRLMTSQNSVSPVKVICESQVQAASTVTTTLSLSTVTSNANSQMPNNPIITNTAQSQGNIAHSHPHSYKAMNSLNEVQADAVTTKSQSVILSSKSNISVDHGPETNHQDTTFVIADGKGTIYTLDGDGESFPLPPNVKNGSHNQGHGAANALHNVINIADINGHVIGPDNTGQAYLLVPSSESTFNTQTKTTAVTESSTGQSCSTSVVTSVSKEEKSLLPTSEGNTENVQALSSSITLSSSSALLSKLSQLASKEDKTQTLIQHDSALSAFHKCAPNKQAVMAKIKAQGSHCNSEPVKFVTHETSASDKIIVVSSERQTQSVVEDGKLTSKEHGNSRSHPVRKRKASKSRDVGMKDKKRQNTTSERSEKCSEEEDVVIVDVEKNRSNTEEHLSEDPLIKSVKQTENPCPNEKCLEDQEKSKIDFSDTESLLKMIVGSRSLTVKQTVMAINSLKAEAKRKSQDSKLCSSSDLLAEQKLKQTRGDINSLITQQSSSESTEACDSTIGQIRRSSSCFGVGFTRDNLQEGGQTSGQRTSNNQRSLPKILQPSKRNMSLNLESLESDALLDNEPTLDQRLVVDVGEVQLCKPDSMSSVAVVARTFQPSSSSSSNQEGPGKKFHRSTYTMSAETLRSYQMILKGQKTSEISKVDSNTSQMNTFEPHSAPVSKRLSYASHPSHTKAGRMPSLPRRSMSCVRDVLERGSSSTLEPLKYNNSLTVERTNGVEYFDELLSKIQSKSEESLNSSNGTKSTSQTGRDLDIPVDVVDFVTESMSSQNMFNVPSARCLSVPNTRPDFCNLLDHVNGPSDKTSSATREHSLHFLDSGKGNHTSDKRDDGHISQPDEHGSSDKQNVFLSPVGPAKLARRLSAEKSLTQPTVDRSMAKTPVEFSSPKHNSESISPIKLCSGTKGLSSERQSARTPIDKAASYSERRAKTPFDTTVTVQTNDKNSGKLGPSSQSPDESWSSKAPVSRSRTRTPMDKFFHKIDSEGLLSKSQLESLNQQYSRDQILSSDEFLSSQTPTSDAGYRSISETPISDFGYNSISPSPVMMSSTSFFGECGRREITSPATIFMPLRSDSALSLNNTVSSEQISFPPQANLADILPSVSNQDGETFPDEPDQCERATSTMQAPSTHLPDRLSSLSHGSSQSEPLRLQGSSEKENEPNECRNVHGISSTLDFTKLVSLHNIPTPPFSPNSALMSTAPVAPSPVPFSIPFSPVPNHESSHSPPSLPRFLLPCSANMPLSNYPSSSSPPRYSCPQDHPSPSIPHVLTPSPHILARPPSSPHTFGTHPSPPFTPSSQRSLPSPCPTPLSFKSLISPRSITPSVDGSAVPNGFMPIQSSYIQTASVAPSHIYIQPIKPVVTLASPSSHKGGDESQVQTSNSSSIIQLPFMEISPEGKKHGHGRCTPSTSLFSSATKNQHIIVSNKLVKSNGSDQLSSFSQESDLSKSRNINPNSSAAAICSSQESKGQKEKPEPGRNNVDLPCDTNPLPTNHSFVGNVSSSDHFRNNESHALRTMQKSLAKPEGQISNSNRNSINALKLIQNNCSQSSFAKTFHDADTTCLSTPFSHQETVYVSHSNTPVVMQTKSPFASIPSKLQVDLTKLEASQNPTSTIHSKPFQTSRCEINLDSCELPPFIKSRLMTHEISPSVTLTSASHSKTVSFDSKGKDGVFQSSKYEDLPNISRPTDNLWNENLSKRSCQDDLQATLDVLRGMDSHYFPSDEDNSNSGPPSGK